MQYLYTAKLEIYVLKISTVVFGIAAELLKFHALLIAAYVAAFYILWSI